MKTLKLLIGIAIVLIVCYLSFLSIRNDIRENKIGVQKDKTIDSCFLKMDAINKEADIYNDSISYWSNRLKASSYANKEYKKYLVFRDRNDAHQKINNKEFWELQSIFTKANK